MLQEVTSLADGGSWTLLYILFEKDSSFLVCLAWSSRALSGLKRASLSSHPRVALNRGEAYIEQARRLSFGHTSLYGSNYLLAEIFGVGSHPLMIAYGSNFMLTAVEEITEEVEGGTDHR